MRGITRYQLEILQLIKAGNPDDKTGAGLIDFDQLLDRLSWCPSKESAQFTIRAIATKKLIEKAPLELRRGRKRVCYRLTLEGEAVLDPRSPLPKSAEPSVLTDLVLPVEMKVEVSVPGVFEVLED